MDRPDSIVKLQDLTRTIDFHNLTNPASPISRANVARLFQREAPRSVDAVHEVFSCQRKAIGQDPTLARLLDSLAKVLTSRELDEAIQSGLLTYTMFKPNIGKSLLDADEVPEEEEYKLIESWREEFRNRAKGACQVLVPTSTVMTPETYELFYAGNKEWQSEIPVDTFPEYTFAPENTKDRTLFEQIKRGMLSGPTTPGVVYAPKGNAIQSWREILGPSNPTKDRHDPKYEGSFRSRNARESSNTLVHGSGKVEEAQAEIRWYAARLMELVS